MAKVTSRGKKGNSMEGETFAAKLDLSISRKQKYKQTKCVECNRDMNNGVIKSTFRNNSGQGSFTEMSYLRTGTIPMNVCFLDSTFP